MTTKLSKINKQHQTLLERVKKIEVSEAITEAKTFLEQLAQAGADVANARQRSQLRAIIRYWSSFMYDHTGQFADIELLPASISEEPSEIAKTKQAESSDALPELMTSIKQIGPYQIIEEIGQGGFSKVYQALDTENEQLVALKVLEDERFQQSSHFKERLLARERLVAELDHPRIIPIYSIAEYDNLPCIAMQFVASGSLVDRLSWDDWKPSVRTILQIAHQTVEGLAHLHSKKIVHRDVKPANLLLSFDDQIYLTDFGIAQVFESAFKGMIVGTPEYIAPEGILHPDNVDSRADLYSVGIILYELFIGKPPFWSESVTKILHKHVNQPVPQFGDIEESIFFSKKIATIIYKCLEKDPDKRFQDAKELLDEIEQLQSSLPSEILVSSPIHFTTSPDHRYKPHKTQKLWRQSKDNPTVLLPTVSSLPPSATPAQPEPDQLNTDQIPSLSLTPASRELPCPTCSTPIKPGRSFCNKCGAAVSEQNTHLLEGYSCLSPQSMLAILISQTDLSTDKYFLIQQNRISIGRGQYNDIIINDLTISRHHALLVYEKPESKSGVFTLYDLASANGTFVNTDQPRVKCKLKHNDLITLGRVKLRFKRLDDDPEPTSTKDDEPKKDNIDSGTESTSDTN